MASPSKTTSEAEISPEFVEMVGFDQNVDRAIESNESIVDEPYSFSKFMAFFSLTIAYMADAWVAQAIGSLLTILNEDLGPSKAYVWMSTAYILPCGVIAITSGRLSDIFGRRDLMIAANVFCIVGAIIWATAKSVNMFIVGSAINGFGAGIHQISYASISELVPRKHRPLALGIYQTLLAFIAAIAPPCALILNEKHSWRWLFWISLAFYGSSFFLLFIYYRPLQGLIRTDGIPIMDHIRSLDWLGIFLFATGMCLFLIGLSFGGTVYAWKSAGTLVPMVLGLVILILFGVWEANCTSQFPLLPKKVIKEVRLFAVPCAGAALFGMVYYSTAVLWPTQVQALYETEAAKIGGMDAIPSATSWIGGLVAGYLFSRFGHGREIFIVIAVALTAISGAQASVSPNSKVASSVIVALMGPAFAACAILTTAMVQLGVPHEYIGTASALAYTCRTVGGSISTVVYVTILTNGLTKNLFPTVATALAKAGVPSAQVVAVATALIEGDAKSPALATVSPSALEAGVYGIKLAYSKSFRTVYLVSIAFGTLTIIAALFCGNFDSRLTNRVDVQLEKPSVHLMTLEGSDESNGTDLAVGESHSPTRIETYEHHAKA